MLFTYACGPPIPCGHPGWSAKPRDQIILTILNTTNVNAVTYINKMGGTHSLLSQLAKDLCDWCLSHNVLIKAQYLPRGTKRAYRLRIQSIPRLQRLEVGHEIF